ncbi:hypothetical protein ACEWY4_011487 [Coilia grayii]|uniref:Helix-turn-helix domain-containing protein n=1 Tax=Coilia grayii TaxID=363190 RepID=A0ABD1JXT1_9TELE
MSLRRDIHLYHRRLKILDHFEYEDEYEREPFVGPSRWEPKVQAASAHIRALLEGDWMALEDFSPSAEGMNNITSEQRQAIKSLSRNQQLVIKPADKGGQIVMQDRCFYLQEAYRQLSDTTYYTPLSEPLQPSTQVEIRNCINDMYDRKIISSKQRFYLYGPEEPRMRQFYLLPKIHKSPDTWTIPHVLPKGRPIVSDCGSESYRIAEFIDFHINPLSQRHPSYVKDTYSFVDEVSALTVPRGSFLFTVDVDSLYTNIDTTLGLQALKDTFALYPDPLRPDSFILKLLEITLTKNDFEFNGKFYLQTCGCAMGRKYSPSYADIYLARWEEQAFRQCEKTPLIYKRYLDDLFGIWTHSEEDFNHFIQILNSQHPKIKLKQNLQPVCVEFLDTVVFQISTPEGASKLATRVYFKDTDRHALLHRRSFHPRHTFRGLIKAQLIRFHRICTYKKHVDEATAILFEALYPRGYSKRFLRTIKDDVALTFARDPSEYRVRRDVGQSQIIPLVITYATDIMHFKKRIVANFNRATLEYPDLGKYRLITALKRNPNLQDILVHTKMRPETTGKIPENDKGNGHPQFRHLNYIFNTHSGLGKPISQRIGPDTVNLIYCLTCRQCRRLYVGETGGPLKTRAKQHVYHIAKGDVQNVLYNHFRTCTHKKVYFTGLETSPRWSTTYRRRMEQTWINALRTATPWGLNDAAETAVS